MKIAVLLVILLIAPLIQAQDSNTAPKPKIESPPLANPFTQDDLELLVGNVQRPNAMTWHEDYLYVICNGDWTIYKIDDRSGDTITFVFGVRDSSSFIAESTEAGFDFWIPDAESQALWKVTQARLAPVNIASQFDAPWGIARINESRFLVTDAHAHAILEVSERGAVKTILTNLRSPTGIVRDEERIYFANAGSARRGIEWFEMQTDGDYSQPQPLVSGLQSITNLALADDGYLYFGYALGTRGLVGRIQPSQCLEEGCRSGDVETVVFSDMPAPIALTLSDDRRLFMHSRYRPEIYWTQLP